jgi:hypothetical protein
VAAAAAALAGCGGESGDNGSEPSRATDFDRATVAIRDCRVRSVVSLHSGLLVVELRDGGRLELSVSDEKRIYAAIELARPRCGNVIIAME